VDDKVTLKNDFFDDIYFQAKSFEKALQAPYDNEPLELKRYILRDEYEKAL